MRRRSVLIGIAVGSATGFIVRGVLKPTQPEINLTTIMDRTRTDLTEAEVTALFGPPTGEVTNRLRAHWPRPAPGNRVLEYVGTKATAIVEFTPDGRLVRAFPTDIKHVTGLERLRNRLNLWW